MKQHRKWKLTVLLTVLLSMLLCFGLAACDIVSPIKPTEPTVESVQITDKVDSLKVGETHKFVAKVTMSDDTTNADVTWKSSNTQVATIGTDGTVHALAEGKTTISATAGEKNASVQLTVNKAAEPEVPTVKSVQITEKVASLTEGETHKFIATVTMSDDTTNANVTWQSSDQEVATVDADGTVHALAEGTTTITATAGGKSDSAQLTVIKAAEPEPTIESVQITEKVESLTEGETYTFAATVTMSDDTTNTNVTWQSANTQTATVDADGTVHALAAGTTTITATAGDKSDSVELTVLQAVIPVTSITLSGDELSGGELYFTLGDEAVTITVAVLPENATNKEYTYKLEGEDGIVSVTALQDGTGYTIAPQKVGEVKLIVTSAANDQIKAECMIYVDPVAVTDLQIAPASIGGETKFYVGDEQNIMVTVLPENATDKTYEYELSQNGIVRITKIDGGYKVEAYGVGEVTLTITSNGNEAAVATCQITVSAKVVESIEMETEITVEVGESYQLTPKLLPEGVEDENLLWRVSTDGIVTVEDGNVTAIAPGEVTVEVQSGNGVTASCKVIVPKHLTELSIPSALTVYTGEGAQARDIEVTYTPADATYKDFEIKVEQEEEFISAVKGEGKVTITGLKPGEATLTITSTDAKAQNVTATCTITVKDIAEAVPYVSKDAVTIDIQSSETIQVLSDAGEITNVTITNSYTSLFTATAQKTDGVWNVTITGVKFGSASMTVNATVGGKVTNIPVQVTVAADYFYITGNFDSLDWPQQNTEDDARAANVLMTKTSDTTWEITRAFLANDKFYVMPANIDTNWDNALRAGTFYTTTGGSGSTYVGTPDADNAQAKFDGKFTVKLTLSTSGAKWTVIVVYLEVKSASFKADTPSLTYGAEDQDVKLTLSTTPSQARVWVANHGGEITWAVEEKYQEWFTLTPASTGLYCTFTLIKFEGEEEVNVKITAKMTIDEYTYTAEYTLTVMPQGATETPVTELNFTEDGPIYVNVASGWTHTVHATVNAEATLQGVTYSLVEGGSTIYNGQSGDHCFTIDPASGLITAKQFGKVKVRATSEGKDAEGKAVTKDIEILFYSNTMLITGSYYKHDAESWDSNTMSGTLSRDTYVYTWTGVELHNGDKLIFLYSTNDWDHGVMRVAQYHGTDNPGGTVSASTTYDNNAGFTVSKDGIYTINLDINRVEPKASFVKTGDVETEDTWSHTIGLYLNYYDGSTFHEGIASVTNQKIDQDNATVSLVCTFSTVTTTSGSANFGWCYTVDGGGRKYLNDGTKTLTYTGSVTKNWSSSAGWYWWHESATSTNDQLQYLKAGALKGTTWTFTFTFNDSGAPTTCKITSGNATAAANLQAQTAVADLSSAYIMNDVKRQVALLNAVPTTKS